MLRFAADENLNGDIVRGALRRDPQIDILRIQDVGLSGADDPTVLAWAARQRRVLLTHDVTTIPRHALHLLETGQAAPGVFLVGRGVPIGRVIDDILLLAECSLEGEWEGQIHFLPL